MIIDLLTQDILENLANVPKATLCCRCLLSAMKHTEGLVLYRALVLVEVCFFSVSEQWGLLNIKRIANDGTATALSDL